MLETYQNQKARHSKELNDFEGIFFAFSNQQFEEGMKKIGLNSNDTELIYSLGAGGFIRKDRSKAFSNLFKKHAEERKQRNKDEKFLIESIAYELANYEYCITGCVDDALDALNLDKNKLDSKILKKAIIKHNQNITN